MVVFRIILWPCDLTSQSMTFYSSGPCVFNERAAVFRNARPSSRCNFTLYNMTTCGGGAAAAAAA